MSGSIKIGNNLFESDCSLMEVTSNHRPDTSWIFMDLNGHEHRWCIKGLLGVPALNYSPSTVYEVPSLIWVKDGEEYWEDDDEPHPFGHLECRQCGAHVEPGYCADSSPQYIPGLRSFRVNGRSVSKEEFQKLLEESQEEKK